MTKTNLNRVISLTTENRRRSHISSEFEKAEIPFEFFDAITPNDMLEKIAILRLNIQNSPLTEGEIACTVSHIYLWHYLIKNDLPYLAIFEDDIYLGTNCAEVLNQLIAIRQNAHLIKLETFPFDKQKRFVKRITTILGRKIFRLKQRHVGFAGYIITRKGAEYLLNAVQKRNLNIPIDDLVFEILLQDEKYIVWQVCPALVIQDSFLSENTQFESSLQKDRAIRIKREDQLKAENKKESSLIQKLKKEIIRPLKQLYKKIAYMYIPFR